MNKHLPPATLTDSQLEAAWNPSSHEPNVELSAPRRVGRLNVTGPFEFTPPAGSLPLYSRDRPTFHKKAPQGSYFTLLGSTVIVTLLWVLWLVSWVLS